MKPHITGEVYLGVEPERNQKENITIGIITNPVGYLQQAIGNVNIHVWGQHEGLPNHARIKVLLDLLIPVLDDAVHVVGDTTVHVTIENDNGVHENQDHVGKHFYNIRINCITL